ncbi:MAG: hypothetical protein WBW02_01795, partial [Candidatus Sulfotelmatobacter sp.]
PEAGMPGENLFIDGSEHEEDETERGKLGQRSESHAKSPGKFGDAEENGEAFAHLEAFGARGGIFQMAVAAGYEDKTNHQPHKQKSEIGEAG